MECVYRLGQPERRCDSAGARRNSQHDADADAHSNADPYANAGADTLFAAETAQETLSRRAEENPDRHPGESA